MPSCHHASLWHPGQPRNPFSSLPRWLYVRYIGTWQPAILVPRCKIPPRARPSAQTGGVSKVWHPTPKSSKFVIFGILMPNHQHVSKACYLLHLHHVSWHQKTSKIYIFNEKWYQDVWCEVPRCHHASLWHPGQPRNPATRLPRWLHVRYRGTWQPAILVLLVPRCKITFAREAIWSIWFPFPCLTEVP